MDDPEKMPEKVIPFYQHMHVIYGNLPKIGPEAHLEQWNQWLFFHCCCLQDWQ